MRFYKTTPTKGIGKLIGQSVRTKSRKLKKGILLTCVLAKELEQNNVSEVYVAELEGSDVEENKAAEKLGEIISNFGVIASKPLNGRVNLIANLTGFLEIDESTVNQLNRIHESITFATRKPWEFVAEGHVIATIKIIPFAVDSNVLHSALELASTCTVLKLLPASKRKIGLLQTKFADTKSSLLDKTIETTAQRLSVFGIELAKHKSCAHDTSTLAQELEIWLEEKFDLILIMGASAIMDRRDVIPTAIKDVRGEVTHLGMPSEPGNLMLIGSIKGCAVIGLPGCARSPALNGVDFILPKILAGKTLTSRDLTQTGVGGLLKKSSTKLTSRPKLSIEAVVLAAGRSSRMGNNNKLLEEINGVPVLHNVMNSIRGSAITDTIVVLGYEADKVKSSLNGYKTKSVYNAKYQTGLSSSIKTGIEALNTSIDGVIIVLGDMPGITREILNTLIRYFNPEEGAEICVPTYKNQPGNPVLWSKRFFPELCKIEGDIGGRDLIHKYSEFVVQCPVKTDAIHQDVDTQDQLAFMENAMRAVSEIKTL